MAVKLSIFMGLTQLTAGGDLSIVITRSDGSQQTITVLCRIDTQNELNYFKHGGILHYVLRNLMTK